MSCSQKHSHKLLCSLDRNLWRSRVATSTKLHLYSGYILPVMLYRSECWMVKKADVQETDALDQWCLQKILDILWFGFGWNDAVCRMTRQPLLSSVVKSADSLFGYVAQMNELADANRLLFAQPPDNWRRPPGILRSTWIRNVCNDLSSFSMELSEAREAAQNRPFWLSLMKHSATHL